VRTKKVSPIKTIKLETPKPHIHKTSQDENNIYLFDFKVTTQSTEMGKWINGVSGHPPMTTPNRGIRYAPLTLHLCIPLTVSFSAFIPSIPVIALLPVPPSFPIPASSTIPIARPFSLTISFAVSVPILIPITTPVPVG